MTGGRFNIGDYVEVNVRIEQFWAKYPEGRLHTEILSWEGGVVTMKASAYRDAQDERPAATGHAYEDESQGHINKTSAVENCETSAVGRALAMLGFEVKKAVASREEVQRAREQQAAPKDAGPAITRQQLAKAHMLAGELSITHEDLSAGAQKVFGVASLKELSKAQASQMIERLEKKKAEVTTQAAQVQAEFGGEVVGKEGA